MVGWGALVGAIVAIEAGLNRSGRPLLSHDAWDLVESDSGWVAWAVVTSVGFHLLVPRRRWEQALAFGVGVGAAHRIVTRALRMGGVHIP